eukprot:Rhum_TRINITY_DN25571_c0_g1::Rhum_TRINITY_DN25571_c0_g1_i1::g.182392::m.182392
MRCLGRDRAVAATFLSALFAAVQAHPPTPTPTLTATAPTSSVTYPLPVVESKDELSAGEIGAVVGAMAGICLILLVLYFIFGRSDEGAESAAGDKDGTEAVPPLLAGGSTSPAGSPQDPDSRECEPVGVAE